MTLVVLEVVHRLLQKHWSWSLVVAVLVEVVHRIYQMRVSLS